MYHSQLRMGVLVIVYFCMQYIGKEKPCNDSGKGLQKRLPALHRNTQTHFGLAEDNYIGSLVRRISTAETWSEFYTSQRIMPLMMGVS